MRGAFLSFGERLLYEEIYEFIASIVNKRRLNAQLRTLILCPEAPSIARAGAVPPLRKLRCRDSLPALIQAFSTDEDAFVRYISGYSAEIIAKSHNLDIGYQNRNLLESLIKNESNAIIRAVGQRMITGNPLEGFCWKDALGYYTQQDVMLIISKSFVADSYASLLNVGREHEYALTEGVRLLTLRAIFCIRNDYYDNSVLRFCTTQGIFSREIRLRIASVWAIGLLRHVSEDSHLDKALRDATDDVDSRVSHLALDIIDSL
jgi:hypothetical protein